jgi:ligand-binding sensor domain-containing protein
LCGKPVTLKAIFQLLVNRDKLYIGSQNGLYVLDIADREKFFREPTYRATAIAIRNEPRKPKMITSNVIQSLVADSEGNIWVGTGKGLNKLDPLSMKCYPVYSNETVK